jgi:hypothetical protein
MKRFLIALVVLFSSLLAQSQTPKPIGTFDRRSIVIAFYRSPSWNATVTEKKQSLEKARKAGDEAKIRELESWGATSQNLAHEQLAGNAAITNILEALKPSFTALEKSLGLSDVIPAAGNPKQPSVDVTGQLLDWLKADQITRELIQKMQKQE